MSDLRRLFVAEDGVTSIEYALIAMLVALAIIVGATALGVNLGALYSWVVSKFPAVP
jgi:pilus assembly protein Flp/PilA